MSSTTSGDNSGKPAFLAFATGADLNVLKAFARSHQWDEAGIHDGNIKTATEYLKANPSPVLLLVELPSVEEAPGLLDALANVCDPGTKVITIGTINEYSFYCWLMDLGIFSYLLKPMTEATLQATFEKSQTPATQPRHEKPPGKVIGILGTRGGVGATTVALNLAGILAELSRKQVALVDIDPQEGSIAVEQAGWSLAGAFSAEDPCP